MEKKFIKSPFEFAKINDSQLGFKFGDNQCLYASSIKYYVTDFWEQDKVKCKVRVQPTPIRKLEIGKWYVVRDGQNLSSQIQSSSNYVLFLQRGQQYISYCYEDCSDIYNESYNWENWHEVVSEDGDGKWKKINII
jgi:hypothetical protein